jgi:hypothetical protein
MKIPLILLVLTAAAAADPPEAKFRAVTIDDKIQIGYGVAVADVDGDGRPDILLADKRQIVWYQNPGQPPPGAETFAPIVWSKFVIAENLTKNDNVCLAAQDLDGDGKCEIAVGAEWNPGDTVNSGAVFYLIPPADRQQRWEPVKFPNVEPTTHRMKWLKLEDGKWGLVVVPLHGRGNKNGEGAPVKVLCYHKPADVRGDWGVDVIDESKHMTHNFQLTAKWHKAMDDEILFAGREGVALARKEQTHSSILKAASNPGEEMMGAGEIRDGWLPGHRFVYYTTIEPMHGNRLVVTPMAQLARRGDQFQRHVLTDKLTEGHALACGDLLGVKSDQIVVGWRGTPGKEGSTTGVALWTPLDEGGEKWRETNIDPTGMACEDLVLADLNGDGKLDVVASGRATHNVKVYFNETAR